MDGFDKEGDPETRRCRCWDRSMGDKRWERAWASANVRAHGLRGARLLPMAAGIVQRYQDAGVEPPQVLYVNQDCCSSDGRPGAAAAMFAEWGELVVRLDIWHLMRRLASGVTTESHQLYRPFMQQLSSAIFEWHEEDAARLQDAKKRTLVAQGMSFPLDAGVWRHVSRKEMALHCRRRTRGAAESERLIDDLLKIFSGDWGTGHHGHSTVGPGPHPGNLGSAEAPPPLHSGPICHLPSAPQPVHSRRQCQRLVVPGLSPGRVDAVVERGQGGVMAAGRPLLRSYAPLQYSLDQLSQRVLGITRPREYTGELIGIEYL
ncbi:uncharacterized protein LOC121697461 [Alosa sapidissima]|uniref:uncharacterized protein LOC121697461 n=1 Tax=Alosa sapidissima TaxID=34773 RepID=UPI001C0966BC|nr:uncharacterized protein LOC121697461 [Alosa sapidissima]